MGRGCRQGIARRFVTLLLRTIVSLSRVAIRWGPLPGLEPFLVGEEEGTQLPEPAWPGRRWAAETIKRLASPDLPCQGHAGRTLVGLHVVHGHECDLPYQKQHEASKISDGASSIGWWWHPACGSLIKLRARWIASSPLGPSMKTCSRQHAGLPINTTQLERLQDARTGTVFLNKGRSCMRLLATFKASAVPLKPSWVAGCSPPPLALEELRPRKLQGPTWKASGPECLAICGLLWGIAACDSGLLGFHG